MTGFDRDLRALLEATRGADDPTAEERVRNRHGLLRKLGALGIVVPTMVKTATASAAVKTAAGVTSGPAAVQVWTWVAVGMFVGLGVAGTTAMFTSDWTRGSILPSPSPTEVVQHGSPVASRRPRTTADSPVAPAPLGSSALATRQLPGSEPVATVMALAPPPTVTPAADLPAVPSERLDRPGLRGDTDSSDAALRSGTTTDASEGSAKPRAVHPAPDSSAADLRAALAVLSRAQQLLAKGRPEQALEKLDRFAAQHQGAALWQERQALRIVALCRMGHSSGEREAQRFLDAAPTSPLAPRLRRACGL